MSENKEEIESIAKAITLAQKENDEIDFSPLITYLTSKNGHEIATEIVKIIKTKVDYSVGITKMAQILDQVVKIVLVALVLGSATWLSIEDKFTPTISLLMGTVVGFVFGKKST